MFKRTVSSALIFGVVALAPPVHAQTAPICQNRDQMVEVLENRFKESLDSIGLQGPEVLLEIWSARDTGSFTVLVTRSNGISCVVASGNNWQKFEAAAKDVNEGIAG